MESPGPEQQVGEAQRPLAEPEEGLLETSVSVITQPVAAMRRLTRDRPVGWAVIVVVVVFLLSALSSLDDMGGIFVAQAALAQAAVLGAAVILGPPLALLATAIMAGILYLSSRLLGGPGSYSGLFVGVAFAGIPGILAVPFNLLPVVMGFVGEAISGVVGLAVGIWGIVLTAIAIRENNGFSTARAVAALLIPLLALLALVSLLAVLVALLVVAAFAS